MVTIYMTVDRDGAESMFNEFPRRSSWCFCWEISHTWDSKISLPKGTIKKITGKTITWEDEPIKYSK